MAQPSFELPLDELGAHASDLRRAAEQGDVVYLTDAGQRLATVIPFPAGEAAAPGSRLDGFVGALPGFEDDVDVETSRDSWDRR